MLNFNDKNKFKIKLMVKLFYILFNCNIILYKENAQIRYISMKLLVYFKLTNKSCLEMLVKHT